MAARGIESILDTTFLSAYATPLAALTGMVIAFLVVRRQFSGKGGLDFVSNLGGAVPGTILGIGFVLAFSTVPKFVVGMLYVLLGRVPDAPGAGRKPTANRARPVAAGGRQGGGKGWPAVPAQDGLAGARRRARQCGRAGAGAARAPCLASRAPST